MLTLIHFLDEQGNLMDSLPIDYQDCFTLDTFGDSCEAFHKEGKCFLIARVRTQDPKQPDKVRNLM